MKKSHQLITGGAVLVALVATVWATLAYQDSQKQVRSLERQVLELQKEQIQVPEPPTQKSLTPTANPVTTPAPPTAPSNPQGPRLQAEPQTLNLGTIRKTNGKATGTFQLKNTGGSSITITYVLTSCGCTTAEDADITLEPQKTHDLKITYDPNYFGPRLELGNVRKWISIFSNDPKTPWTKVYLQANVMP